MVDWLRDILGKEWTIKPAGGLTGSAFIAIKGNRRLFLKRNSSPFLAVLSAQGIVPKLIWTKRMENGDVITAQEWLEGRELKKSEMQDPQVANILHRIHHSSELLHMLTRLGKRPVSSVERYEEILGDLHISGLIATYEEIGLALSYLKELLPLTKTEKHVVCHGDLNHNNLIVTNEGQFYLIDWDNAMIADPIIDFGIVLKSYIPVADWDMWLKRYGITKDKYLFERMHWYLLLDTLQYLNWHNERNELNKVAERLEELHGLNQYIRTTILG